LELKCILFVMIFNRQNVIYFVAVFNHQNMMHFVAVFNRKKYDALCNDF